MKPAVTVEHKSNVKRFQAALKNISKRAVYVGIPASSSRDRSAQLLAMAAKVANPKSKRQTKLLSAAVTDISNAELLFIQSRGSPLRHIPARPVIEPAIEADGSRQIIAREIAGAAKAALDGDQAGVTRGLKRAGIAGQNAARAFFTDPKNGWAPDAPSTIAAKGSDRPLIDTGALRQAITYVVKDRD